MLLMGFTYYFLEVGWILWIQWAFRIMLLWVVFTKNLRKPSWMYLLLGCMAVDFMGCYRLWYPFVDSDAFYSSHLPQNYFVLNSAPLARFGAFQYQLARHTELSKLWERPSSNDLFDQIKRLLYKGYRSPVYEPSYSYFPTLSGRSFYGFHESLMPDYFWDFDEAMNKPNSAYKRQSWIGIWNPASRLLNIAGIKYLFWNEPLHRPNLKEVMRYPGYADWGYVYENTAAVPRAYLAYHTEYYFDRQDLLERLQEKSFNPRESVATEDEALSLFSRQGPKDHAEITHYSNESITIYTHSQYPAILVITDLYDPQWEATIDNHFALIFRVNCLFRGIIVPAGDHQVDMNYKRTL